MPDLTVRVWQEVMRHGKKVLVAITNEEPYLPAPSALWSKHSEDGAQAAGDLAAEIAARKAGDAALQSSINSFGTGLTNFENLLKSPGTFNAPGNPVDWTDLKNVPGGLGGNTLVAGSGIAIATAAGMSTISLGDLSLQSDLSQYQLLHAPGRAHHPGERLLQRRRHRHRAAGALSLSFAANAATAVAGDTKPPAAAHDQSAKQVIVPNVAFGKDLVPRQLPSHLVLRLLVDERRNRHPVPLVARAEADRALRASAIGARMAGSLRLG